nr:immunoglobulin light chain junction region [Macaca mulatta]MOX11803.1 immunoglobulin light chain junction region [Macaca mulatta]MOX12287.1 immunoglobulin light chain junction region [Macaca mulatta]MOX12549.1 immunoglobulin light chain junction region [Macaca mulatta]
DYYCAVCDDSLNGPLF